MIAVIVGPQPNHKKKNNNNFNGVSSLFGYDASNDDVSIHVCNNDSFK